MSGADINYKELMSRALVALKQTQDKLAALEGAAREPIAIIGMACRFPGGVNDPEGLWQLLIEGRDGIGEIPRGRWDVERFFDSDPNAAGKMSTSRGGFIDDVDAFDPLFFGMSPKEAVYVDPQQRLMLEVAWEALENAQLLPEQLHGSRTGVLVGISTMDYCNLISELLPKEEISRHIGTGTAFSPAAGRIAYLLGLTGPAMAVDTACSSSLVATHLAVESLRRGETDLMIVGGAGLILSPMNSITFSKARMLAADGRCKPFSDAADGYGRGEGVAAVILKRLSDAQRDGDSILALIRGSAVNQDGASGGLTIPNGPAQQAVVRQALASGRVDAADISYVETHGTGTSLGDPIELGALGAVFRNTHDSSQPLLVGAAKSNIGHTEAAAGLAGLIKVVLQLQHREIPPLLHFDQPSRHINWQELPLAVPTRSQPWTARNGKWLAGVSAFGFSGTNAHVVVERAPDAGAVPDGAAAWPCILALSAHKPEALRALAARYAALLHSQPQLSLVDVCCSALLGRPSFEERAALVARSRERVLAELDGLARGEAGSTICTGSGRSGRHPGLAFIFGMTPALEEAELAAARQRWPLWGAAWKECMAAAQGVLAAGVELQCFAEQYASARLWPSWGVQASKWQGQGSATPVLACAAGVVALPAALQILRAVVDGADHTALQRLLGSLLADAVTVAGLEALCTVDGWIQRLSQPELAEPDASHLPLPMDSAAVLPALARLYAAGVAIDWRAVCAGQRWQRVRLPNYPFQRQRYWPNMR